MGFFDDWLLPIFTTAVEVAQPELAPALEGTKDATALANAADITATAADAANIADTANAANMLNSANAGLNVGAMDTLGAGLGQSANQAIAAGQAGQVGSGLGLDAIQGAQAVQDAALTQGTNIAPGITSVNPATAGNPATAVNAGAPGVGIPANMPSPYADFNMAGPSSAYSPLTGTAAQAGAGLPTTVSGASDSALGRGFDKAMAWAEKNPIPAAMMAASVANGIFGQQDNTMPEKKPSALSKYKLGSNFQGSFPTPNVYKPRYAAEGGIMNSYAAGGLDSQSPMVAGMGNNTGYPQGMQDHTQYATPSQMPTSSSVINADYEQNTNPYTGEPVQRMAAGGIAGKGGATSDTPVYYDSSAGKYYTLQNSSPLGGMFGNIFGGDPQKTYIDSMGGVSNFTPQTVTPNVYTPGYDTTDTTTVPVSHVPMAQALNRTSQQIMDDSYGLLQQTAPQIAESMQAPTATTSAAQGGIMGYKGGGIPGPGIDTGEVSEDDPDFAFTSPYETAAGRLKKLYSKTHYGQKPPVAAPGLGKVNLVPANMQQQNAAQGGIMGAPNLGGYAAGGNPRLLKGPGDGMSDNIPATIGDRQPARLADGEFVVPADVVSHLGNGSTDAGAKKLHGMMDTVRKARTGRKAQGKQINADKFIPK